MVTSDRELTQKLVTALTESPLVVLMIFDDPQVTASSKLIRDPAGVTTHHDHVHVEFRKHSS